MTHKRNNFLYLTLSLLVVVLMTSAILSISAMGGAVFKYYGSDLDVQSNILSSIIRSTADLSFRDDEETYTINFVWQPKNDIDYSNKDQIDSVQAKNSVLVPDLGGAYPDGQIDIGNYHIFVAYFSRPDANGKLYYSSNGTFTNAKYSLNPVAIFDENDFDNIEEIDGTKNVTLYAFYREDQDSNDKITYIALNSNGGNLNDDTKDSNLLSIQGEGSYGYRFPSNVAVPQKQGYRFDGYYDVSNNPFYDGDGQSLKSGFQSLNTVPKVLNAKWIDESIVTKSTVTLDHMGGTGGSESVIATYGEKMPEVNNIPSKKGYGFLGYYDNKNYQGTPYYINENEEIKSNRFWDKEEDTTLYARWRAWDYDMYLDHNDGSEIVEKSPAGWATSGQPMPSGISKPTHKDEGYEFVGYWDVSDTTGGNQYYDAEMNSVTNWDKDQYDATLYARWNFVGAPGGGGENPDTGNPGGGNGGNNGNNGDNGGNNGNNGGNDINPDGSNPNDGTMTLVIAASVGVAIVLLGIIIFLKKKGGSSGARTAIGDYKRASSSRSQGGRFSSTSSSGSSKISSSSGSTYRDKYSVDSSSESSNPPPQKSKKAEKYDSKFDENGALKTKKKKK